MGCDGHVGKEDECLCPGMVGVRASMGGQGSGTLGETVEPSRGMEGQLDNTTVKGRPIRPLGCVMGPLKRGINRFGCFFVSECFPSH